MTQFGRQYQLELVSDEETLIINNLRVAFDVDKTITEKPNPATFRVWNLNRDHINQALSQGFKKAVLSVGYQALKKIYSGDITKVRINRDNLDFILTIECADGFRDYTGSRSAVTIKAGASDKEIVDEILKKMGNSERGTIEIINKRKLPRGRVLNGDNRHLLSQVSRNSNANWSIQDGALTILPKDKVLNEEAVLISQDTGMIGSPEQTDDGLELTCLLNPLLQIGGLVEVRSILDYFNGEYKIVKLVHSGDVMSGDWQSKMTVVGGKFQKVEKENTDGKKKDKLKK